jgi:hypothetical protein
MSKHKRGWNPVRGTLWLPADVADLNEIDFEPLPEPAQDRTQTPLFAPEEGRVAA